MEINQQLLVQHNPWWVREELILEDDKITEYERQALRYFPPILREFPHKTDAVLTLRGPRQIGKSTSVKLLIRKLLLDDKTPRRNVFYFALDRIEDFNQLYELIDYYLRGIRAANQDRLYLFLDEISFVREWQRGIKALADDGRLKNTTLLLTGSNLLDLRKGAERLPGRRGKLDQIDFEQLPMTFAEFVCLKEPALGLNHTEELYYHLDLLQLRFDEYLIAGGFPLSMNLYYATGRIPAYVYQLYLSWIEGDVGKAGKHERNMYQIISRVLSHMTTPVSWHKLGKEAGIASHATAQEYIEILERMFVLYIMPFADLSTTRPVFRKNRKIYFQDPLIFHCFSGRDKGVGDNFFPLCQRFFDNPADKAKLVENVVGMHLVRAYKNCFFWQGKKEIDFVAIENGRPRFFEVKYQEKTSAAEFQWFSKLRSGKERLNVVTRHQAQQGETASLIPAPVFLLQLPRATEVFGEN